jgi:predicted nucleotidyltransferase
MFPTGAFETGTQRRILRVLAEKNRRYTAAELTELCHRSRATISRALRDVDRYPFISKESSTRSKQQLYSLDSESEYAAAIHEFFAVERRRERRNGTVPVDVWNRLEDITDRLEGKSDSLLELFLFGSYARGDYYTGSDIDLLLVTTKPDENTKRIAEDIVDSMSPDRDVQFLTIDVEPPDNYDATDEGIVQHVRARAPVSDEEPLIPLTGRVSP